jgi:hypothetical protein
VAHQPIDVRPVFYISEGESRVVGHENRVLVEDVIAQHGECFERRPALNQSLWRKERCCINDLVCPWARIAVDHFTSVELII